jgi:hypothetical protein
MARSHGTKTTILNLCVEMFFAVLPLVVLRTVWPPPGNTESFWSGPELPMTGCILYGLTLARQLQGAVFAAVRARGANDHDVREVAASYSVLFLLPLMGVIISVLLISKTVQGNGNWSRILMSSINLASASGFFLILGGHGLKWTEGGGEEK